MSFAWFVLAGGIGGALLMLAPDLFVRLADRQGHFTAFGSSDLFWPGIAFVIAAPTAAIYRVLVAKRRSPIH
jgi:hypothetical protein